MIALHLFQLPVWKRWRWRGHVRATLTAALADGQLSEHLRGRIRHALGGAS